ncbi:hypothetical protein OOZ15_07000 [Galbibacter sp. EGI 63066]|uniref:hypothetical protein n=1 Tax=Galbibacter sp. EGI 63066 TaxID=2993559 RepID=UPI00224922D3|nr:hypothetical protein [Galbibacter sp. EGI 63066]MCX2679683.1 hypothetical protein [Galbibacter sp. EGI 63066]
MFGFKKVELTKDEKHIQDIVSKYAENDAVKKMISPISDEYYLIDNDKEISLCIEDGKVTLSNHKFLYEKHFRLSFTENLKKQMRQSMENEMQELKKSLFKNETDLLSMILEVSNG